MQSGSRYLNGIAGLRAIAVLSVVAYHLDPRWMPGGFVGVDIFFVISGFVVAHSVMTTPARTLRDYIVWFYRRRFQRIFPAALAFIVVAAILGTLLIPNSPNTRFIEITGAAAVFGLSNLILLLKTGDYFSAASEFNTFTHTWSLAVEEQYYLLFPFLSFPILMRNRLRHPALLSLAAGVIVSLAAAWFFTARWQPFAFYMLPTRFWELGLGFLLRLALARGGHTGMVSVVLRPWVAAIPFVALLAACLVTSPDGFPFPNAVLPCMATAGIIATIWCWPGVWTDRLLSLRPLTSVGDISYSLYLWHWGVIVLMRWTIGADTLPLKLAALMAMSVLAVLSYRCIEMPFRKGARTIPTRRLFAGVALSALVVSGLCVGLFVMKVRIGLSATNDIATWSPYAWAPAPGDRCGAAKRQRGVGAGLFVTFDAPCRRAGAPRLFVLGDSHAGAYQRMLWRIAAGGAYEVHLYTMGGCRPIYTTEPPLIPGCDDFLRLATADIAKAARPGDTIFLPALHTPRYRDDWGHVATTDVAIDRRPLAASAGVIAESRRKVAMLAALGARVVIEAPKPLVPTALYRCADAFNRPSAYCRVGWSVSRAAIDRRTARPRAAIGVVMAGLPGVRLWDPTPILCPGAVCDGYRGGRPLYFDTDHLSGYGNDLLYAPFLAMLRADDAGERSAPPE